VVRRGGPERAGVGRGGESPRAGFARMYQAEPAVSWARDGDDARPRQVGVAIGGVLAFLLVVFLGWRAWRRGRRRLPS